MSYTVVEVDDPAPHVRRVTMNRPEKRNALNHALRGEIIQALQEADRDENIHVSILRGAGPTFSAGYDLTGSGDQEEPWFTAEGEGHWPRHVTQGWFSIWDLAKPVIAQVHGYCLAGGSELATCCDLVYMAEDAQMGYPAVRFGVPDNHFHAWFVGMRKAMEMMLTGDSINGKEAVEKGWANEAFPENDLEKAVLVKAERIAAMPQDLVQLNKRLVHRQMEIMGLRTGIRAGSELCALGIHTKTMQDFIGKMRSDGVAKAARERDAKFGDYASKKD